MSSVESHANAKKGKVPKQVKGWIAYVKENRKSGELYSAALKRLSKSWKPSAGKKKAAGMKKAAGKAPCATGATRKLKDGTKKRGLTSYQRFQKEAAREGRKFRTATGKRRAYLKWAKENGCEVPKKKKDGAKKAKVGRPKKAHKNAIGQEEMSFEEFERQFLQSMGHMNARRASAAPKSRLASADEFDGTYAQNLRAHANARARPATRARSAPVADNLIDDDMDSIAHENARRRKRGAPRKGARRGRRLAADGDDDAEMQLLADS